MSDDKKIINLYIVSFIILLILTLVIMSFNKNTTAISSFDLIKDTYITEDYVNDVFYENTIYVPDKMTRVLESSKTATYLYRNEDKTFTIRYGSCIDDECIKSYKSDDKFKNVGKYFVFKSDNKIKIYFKNSFDIYQTIEIGKYNYKNESLKKDKTYTKLLENMTVKKANYDKYYINPKEGYYKNSIIYNDYKDENNITAYKIDYKVDANKYQTNYDKNSVSPCLYIDKTQMSFFDGEITNDVSSIKAQTKIEIFILKNSNLNIDNEAVNNLNLSFNQNSFESITKDDVEIKKDQIEYKNNKIDYYHIISNNNNSHGERIAAYLKLKDDYYYVIQIYGGEGKELDANMINDFLPTKITNK